MTALARALAFVVLTGGFALATSCDRSHFDLLCPGHECPETQRAQGDAGPGASDAGPDR